MQFKVFVSYSSIDLKEVEALKKQLKSTPIEIFIAEYSISPSEELISRINNAIATCDLFVVLWSENAKNSGWVDQEIGKANTLKKSILPLVLDPDVKPTGFISGIKYLPLYGDKENALEEARQIIETEYQKKVAVQKQRDVTKKKNKETLFAAGVGAFLLWAASQ